MKTAKPSAQIQCLIGAIVFTGVAVLAVSHRYFADRRDSEQFTADRVEQVKVAYLSQAFGLEQHIANYELARDYDNRSPDIRRIYALGAQRVIAYQGRLVQIQSSARSAPAPAQFLELNIARQEAALSKFIDLNPIIPPGSPQAKAFADLTLELELWYRCKAATEQANPAQPYPANIESLKG